jgi:NhaP-type Na+/H+ and K+/H+ antiporter
MGPTFGLAALLTLVLLAIWIAQHDSEGKRRKLLDLLFAGLGVVVGLGIAYLSPGTQARATIFESNEVTFAPDSLVGWIMGIIPENFTMFGELLFHWGSLILIVFFVGLGFLATRKFMNLKTEKVLPIAIGLATFGVALTSATIVTDALSYGAYWHSSSIAVVAYGVCASVGFWAGGLLARQGFESAVLVASFALLVGLTGGIGSSLDLSTSIVEREAAWRDGPAPIKGIIEDREVDWIGNCAVQLEEVNPTFS